MIKKIRILLIQALLISAVLFATGPSRASEPNGDPSNPPDASQEDTFSLFSSEPLSTPDESGGDRFVPDQLIVKINSGISTITISDSLSSLGIIEIKELGLPGYSLLTVAPDNDIVQVADSLRQEPFVDLVELNYYRYAFFNPNDPYYRFQWHFPLIQMPYAWDYSSGPGVVVAVVDTGVAYENYGGFQKAPDFASTLFVPGWNYVANNAHPNDDYGHGTHMAGTIAQSTNNGLGVAGIAYSAAIMPIKVLDAEGRGSDAAVASGIVWAANHGAKVINLSLGGPDPSTLLETAVDYAYNKGALIIAAAGNEATSSVSYPAAYGNAISVGAIRNDQTLAYYSSYGTALDLVAPGGDFNVDQNTDGYVDGVLQQTFAPGRVNDFRYYFVSGTSSSAAHVSGVAALLFSRGDLSRDQVRQALMSTAKDLGTPGRDDHYGAGLVQAYTAMRWTPPVVSPPLSGLTPRLFIPGVVRNHKVR